MNWLNLTIIIILFMAAKAGQEKGLAEAIANLFLAFWGILIAFTFLPSASRGMQTFLIADQYQARFVSLWLLFLITALIIWGILGNNLRKEKIVFLPAIDRWGGLGIGLIFGCLIAGFLVSSIYLFPAPVRGKDKKAAAFLEKPVLFSMDELLPRLYKLAAEKKPEGGEGAKKTFYTFEEFMFTYNPIKGEKYSPEKARKEALEKARKEKNIHIYR